MWVFPEKASMYRCKKDIIHSLVKLINSSSSRKYLMRVDSLQKRLVFPEEGMCIEMLLQKRWVFPKKACMYRCNKDTIHSKVDQFKQ